MPLYLGMERFSAQGVPLGSEGFSWLEKRRLYRPKMGRLYRLRKGCLSIQEAPLGLEEHLSAHGMFFGSGGASLLNEAHLFSGAPLGSGVAQEAPLGSGRASRLRG